MNAFADWQPRYAEHGIVTFPVDGKKPLIRNYLKIGKRGSSELVRKFPFADAFGVGCRQNRICVVDVDAPDERLLAEALDEFGQTPYIVRSGSGNYHAWYRHAGESRRVRPDPGRPIDILGDGFVVAPPSRGLKGRYEIIQGTLDDLQSLPPMRKGLQPPDAVSPTTVRVPEGQRNDKLWRECMRRAKGCGTIAELTEAAMSANQVMLEEALPIPEVAQIVAKAWAKELKGENWFGSGKRIVLGHDEYDGIADAPDALALLIKLRRHHWGQSREFVIANEMAAFMPGGGWTRKRFAQARQTLEQLGKIQMIRPASAYYGPALYRFKN